MNAITNLSYNSSVGNLLILGTLTANTLSANTLTANTLSANTLSANTLSANTLTANTLTANTLTANTLTANTLTTNTLTANTLSANTLTANTLTANTLTANTLTANTLTANTLTANTLTANTLSANTLTANNITISGLANSVNNTINIPSTTLYITSGYGYIWTSSFTDNKVSVINPTTMLVEHIIEAGSPSGINYITSGYGYIWVSTYTTGSIQVIDPNTMNVSATITLSPGAQCITSGYGYIWATIFAGGSGTTISVIDPNTMTQKTTVTVGSGPYGITDGYGYIWVGNLGSSTISVINPNGIAIEVIKTIAITNPLGITSGYGYIWVISDISYNIVVIDPSTMAVVKTISIGNYAQCLTSGYGYIWVACNDTLVMVIDPITLTIVESIEPGSYIQGRGIAYGYDNVWVSNPYNTISVIKGQGILNSYDVNTYTLEVNSKATINGDMEIVNSLTINGSLNANTITSANGVYGSSVIATDILADNIESRVVLNLDGGTLQLNNDPGLSGQVLTSQGAYTPIWTTPSTVITSGQVSYNNYGGAAYFSFIDIPDSVSDFKIIIYDVLLPTTEQYICFSMFNNFIPIEYSDPPTNSKGAYRYSYNLATNNAPAGGAPSFGYIYVVVAGGYNGGGGSNYSQNIEIIIKNRYQYTTSGLYCNGGSGSDVTQIITSGLLYPNQYYNRIGFNLSTNFNTIYALPNNNAYKIYTY